MQVVVPVKAFARAKSRLGPIFDARTRERLARAMAQTILTELASIRDLRGILVVSSEPQMREFCHEFDIDFLWDDGRKGLNEALSVAERHLNLAPGQPLAVVCADLPFFRASEFRQMAARHEQLGTQGLTIAADQYQLGTNVRIATAINGIPYRYGPNSAALHFEEAKKQGIACQFYSSEALELDLDTPTNVFDVVRRSGPSISTSNRVVTALLDSLSTPSPSEEALWVN
jgi:2-phospho-L-lactate guanylyltransferase